MHQNVCTGEMVSFQRTSYARSLLHCNCNVIVMEMIRWAMTLASNLMCHGGCLHTSILYVECCLKCYKSHVLYSLDGNNEKEVGIIIVGNYFPQSVMGVS